MLMVAILALSAIVFEASAATADRFEDVDPGAWYYDEVAGAVDADLFKGIDTFRFKPLDKITRAEFVTAVARLCGADTSSYKTEPFTDVADGFWAQDEIAWAYSKKIVEGVSKTQFAPNRQITRAEMCQMLVGGIEKGLKKSLSTAGATTFTDQAKIPSWAATAVKKCSANGIIDGISGAFVPSGKASRAEAAAVFYRYHKSTQSAPLLEVKGFYIDFKADQYYYTCPNANFDNCRIIKYNGSGSIENLQVKHHMTNKVVSHKVGDKLNLGFVRAKVTFTIGSKNYTLMLTEPSHANYARKLARTTTSVNLRNKPTSTGSTIITTLSKNNWVYFYEKTGNWYKVKVAATGQEGYMSASYLQIGYYDEVEIPESYKAKIDALKKAHPNWTFSFVDVEMTYEKALSTYGSANADYVNPVKYLDETNIFAFLDVSSYQEGSWTADQVEAMWKYGYNASESAVTTKQFVTQAMTTAKSALMNPLYMASRAILESKYGKSNFAKGMSTVTNVYVPNVIKPENLQASYPLGATYYNFYGIGAYNSNPRYAMIYAKNQGWNTKERALIEGAAWIKQEYLDWGDLTPYFMRFAFKTQYAYMTDVTAPQSEASILKRAYSDPNAKAHFIVPVYR